MGRRLDDLALELPYFVALVAVSLPWFEMTIEIIAAEWAALFR